jgi:hypothetical protein
MQLAAQSKGSTFHSTEPVKIEANQTYTVAMIDFVAMNTYKLPKEKLNDTGKDMRAVIITGLNAK